jgi:tetratricopeptide (TPR) repeat protein
VLAALMVLLLGGYASASGNPTIELGDRAWARRAEGAEGDRAAPGPIAEAIAAYEAVLALEPDSLEAIWKLQRALHFQGQYTRLGASKRARIWERGTDLAERSIAILHRDDPIWHEREPALTAAKVADRSLGAAVHFWAAVHWGLWGETKGALPAVRKGIAKRIRDHALLAIELDETYESGGPHRLLGRLHALAPRVPLLTGWVSRDEALRHLERAAAIAPADFGNRLYLAEARLENRPEQREQALAALQAVTDEAPDPEHPVEDRRLQIDAREALERARSASH